MITKVSTFQISDKRHSDDIKQATKAIQIFQILDKSIKDLFDDKSNRDMNYKDHLKSMIKQSGSQSIPEEIII